MVHPGHASKGCRTCKIRRIKCDETQPVCRKCTNSKRICLGYDKSLCTDTQAAESSTVAAQNAAFLHSSSDFHDRAADAISTCSKKISCHDVSNIFQQPQLSMQAVHSAIEACFQSLQSDVAQTIEQRRNLHKKYQSAMTNLRRTISSMSSGSLTDSSMAAYCFALYEVSETSGLKRYN
jgi:hypothetical protein